MDKTDIFGFWRHFDDTGYLGCSMHPLPLQHFMHKKVDTPDSMCHLFFSVLFIPVSFMKWRHFWLHRCSNMRRYQTFSVKFAVDSDWSPRGAPEPSIHGLRPSSLKKPHRGLFRALDPNQATARIKSFRRGLAGWWSRIWMQCHLRMRVRFLPI